MDTESNFEIKNIIWALDVFTDIPEVEEIVAKNISLLLKTMNIKAKIFPINVSPGNLREEHFPFVTQEINQRLEKIKSLNLEPVNVIPEKMIYPTSVNDKVITLIDHAKSINCDLIIVTTHAHQSASHYLIGSFTNELISESPISLMVLNPSCPLKTEFQNVLLPIHNDGLNETECKIIGQIVNSMNANLILFYHIQDQANQYFTKDGPMWKILKHQQHNQENNIEAQQKNLRQIIEGQIPNFRFETIIDTISMKESISRFIKTNNISLVLLGGFGSKITKRIPVSVIEYVMRSANCPVFIVR